MRFTTVWAGCLGRPALGGDPRWPDEHTNAIRRDE